MHLGVVGFENQISVKSNIRSLIRKSARGKRMRRLRRGQMMRPKRRRFYPIWEQILVAS